MFAFVRTMRSMAIDPRRFGIVHTATDGRDILLNKPDGWEVDQPWLWWDGPADGDGTGGPWGNPPPGAEYGAPSMRGTALPAFNRAVQLVANKLAGMPWKVYRGRDRMDTPLWITDPQVLSLDGRRRKELASINDVRFSGVEFWEQFITSHIIWGEGIAYAPRMLDDDWEPTGEIVPPLYLLHPKHVHISDDDRYYVLDIDMDQDDNDARIYLDQRELIITRNILRPGRQRGLGVVQAFAADLGLSAAIREYADNMFQRGIPNGYLKSDKPDLTQQQADELKRRWMRSHGGNRKSIGVLNATTEFKPLNLDPQIVALVDMLKLSAWQMALMVGVPPARLGISMGDSNTYANLEAENTAFIQDTHLPIARKIEAALDAKLPHGTSLKIDFRSELRGDTKTRYETYEIAIRNRMMTVEEVREAEDLPPLTAGPVGGPGTHAAEGAGAAALGGTRNRTSLTGGT